MSYDAGTDKVNWRDELTWAAVSFCSGLVLALVYLYFDRFPGTGGVAIVLVCSLGFYLFSILIRIQNSRGRILTGKTAVAEHSLLYVFPVLGFLIGAALLLMG